MTEIRMKRVYDTASSEDGYRILVDRLWPRGLKKDAVPYDLWAKTISPSPEARVDFAHKKDKMEDFRQRYLHELENNPNGKTFLRTVSEQLSSQNVTLIYAAKDPVINHVVILKSWIESRLQR